MLSQQTNKKHLNFEKIEIKYDKEKKMEISETQVRIWRYFEILIKFLPGSNRGEKERGGEKENTVVSMEENKMTSFFLLFKREQNRDN